MIEINLVPENLRKKKKTQILRSDTLQIPQEAIVGLGGGLLALLFITHVVLFGLILNKRTAKNNLEKSLQAMAEQKRQADKVMNDLRANQGKMSSIEKITTVKRIRWAPKLNAISDSLPRGVWLNKIFVEEGVLLVEGSSVSKIADEMTSVGSFTSNLKDQNFFMENLSNLEVGSIQRRKIQSVEIADFSITAKLK